MDLLHFSLYSLVITIFTLIQYRAIYFTFVNKSDPIKAVTLTGGVLIQQLLDKQKAKKAMSDLA